MIEPLHLKYRPASFQEMIGQKYNAVVLQRMIETGLVPHAFLFSGPSGVGKTSAARILATELNQTDAPGQYTIEVDAASNGGVAEVRALIETLRYSTGGAFRIVILDEAQSLTRAAFEVLLKPLEEPPSGTIFVLVTTEPEKIPETILSRLREFEFRRVTATDIGTRLAEIARDEKIEITRELLMYIAENSNGNVRKAIMTLDHVWLAQVTTVAEYIDLAGIEDSSPALVAALMSGDHARIFSQLDQLLSVTGNPSQIAAQLVRCLRDLTVIKAGGTLTITGPSFESRKELALRLELERILAAMKLLWDLKTRVRVTDDPRGNLELALMLIAEVFTRGKTAPPVPSTPPAPPAPLASPPAPTPLAAPKKLTLADLQKR